MKSLLFLAALGSALVFSPISMGATLRPAAPRVLSAAKLRAKYAARDQRAIRADRRHLRSLAGRSGVARERAMVVADLRLRRRSLNALRRGGSPWERPLVHLRPGAIGRVFALSIVQIMGPQAARATILVPYARERGERIASVPGAAPIYIVKYKGHHYLADARVVALVGWRTANLRDGEGITQHGLVQVAKPLTYQAVGGQMTIPAIRPVVVQKNAKATAGPAK